MAELSNRETCSRNLLGSPWRGIYSRGESFENQRNSSDLLAAATPNFLLWFLLVIAVTQEGKTPTCNIRIVRVVNWGLELIYENGRLRTITIPCFSTLYNLNPGTESDMQSLEFEDL
jgi:hypothetical protein